MPPESDNPPAQSHIVKLVLAAGAVGIFAAVVAFLLVSGGDDDGASTASVTDVSTPTPEATPKPTVVPTATSEGTPDDVSPPATGPATIEEALAGAFDVPNAASVADCATADFADSLCYSPYLTNLDAGRYLFLIGAPFSEVFAWALVEQQGDGTYLTTETATYDFEGDGSPPFDIDGPMAAVQFTSDVIEGQPIDRIDDGNSPLPPDATEMTVYVRYAGFDAFDSATVVVMLDGARVGDPSAISTDTSGEGFGTIVIGDAEGGTVAPGTYTATLIRDGVAIAEASAVVLAA